MAEVDIPLCVECIHCGVFHATNQVEAVYRCNAMTGMPNPINGEPIVSSDCGWMRLGCDCGREGKLFEAKDKQ